MNLRIGNTSSLQLFQLLRFSTFLVIGIVFTKTQLDNAEIGQYETILFIAGAISFFWVNGIIQSLLATFKPTREKNSYLFSVFFVLSVCSLLAIGFLFLFQKSFSHLFLKTNEIPFLNYLSAYVFFSVPANLIEYLYLLQKQPRRVVGYGIVSFGLMFLLVVLPAIMKNSIQYSLGGLVLSSVFRYTWLIVLLKKYSLWRISWSFVLSHLSLAAPLILSALLSGSAQYIDGFIVRSHFDEATFAIFRYGAREFPLVLLLTNAFSTAMIPRFSESEKIENVLSEIKDYSRKLMHWLFPASILLLGLTHWLFPFIFNSGFSESSTIFNIYLLLIISRLLFPQTILIGLKQTGIIAWASLCEILLNVSLSLCMVYFWGLPGIAYGTVAAYLFEKLFLAYFLAKKEGISPGKYLNISLHLTYSVLLAITFYFVEYIIF